MVKLTKPCWRGYLPAALLCLIAYPGVLGFYFYTAHKLGAAMPPAVAPLTAPQGVPTCEAP